MIEALLPAANESVRCAEFARSLSVDPGGSAIRADLFIAAELALPWPKPVFAHRAFDQLPDHLASALQPSRVLAAVPQSQSDYLSVVAYRRDASSPIVTRQEWRTDADGLAATTGALLTGLTPAKADRIQSDDPSAEVWICTQGSHDLCCGSEGMVLAQSVQNQWPDVSVRRVSHTGGHRFAPTAITLPDGRMWGELNPDRLDAIVRKTGDTMALAKHCRGWWGAEPGAMQVAERAVFSAEGWAWDNLLRRTEIVGETEGIFTVRVSGGLTERRSWIAQVGIRREVPTITCRALGGLPTKVGFEYQLLDLVAQ